MAVWAEALLFTNTTRSSGRSSAAVGRNASTSVWSVVTPISMRHVVVPVARSLVGVVRARASLALRPSSSQRDN